MKVTAAYIQTPFQISLKQVDLPSPGSDQALIEVLACGVCGHDIEIGESLASEPRAFGHEIAGVVREIGENVKHVKVGDQVALESSSFCCDCDLCRNGRVDLCNKGAGFWTGLTMGFSDAMLVPGRCLVPAPDMDVKSVVLAEPCGVAVDMIKTAEIGLTDKVLVVGAGIIGLMGIAIARRLTTGAVVAVNRSKGKLSGAMELGADDAFSSNEISIPEIGARFGGFDKIMITAPPQVIPDCISAAAYGGYIAFIGSDFKGGGVVPIDTHALHFGKKQLRSSFASPAMYFPQALHLLKTGVVPADKIISHTFPLSQIDEAVRVMREDRETVRKVIVIPDSKFKA
ncbi:alcohol dehydrogenase catalytic domain-containing protein [uncultured Desulfobulbus sp.]|uniref:zinc-dependent alcohol dehydrogenase n=1 Tax=uncultured Desulfobulbus sp. TaxID=239745 RepID=UPI0029C88E37|nr:alcohol dehydrogenase catalytic domain-containing protein [uncultured Desulfobulbus sp.]